MCATVGLLPRPLRSLGSWAGSPNAAPTGTYDLIFSHLTLLVLCYFWEASSPVSLLTWNGVHSLLLQLGEILQVEFQKILG